MNELIEKKIKKHWVKCPHCDNINCISLYDRKSKTEIGLECIQCSYRVFFDDDDTEYNIVYGV
jgi:DNA-directed RNA polymerase subunit RPC12/RpoP